MKNFFSVLAFSFVATGCAYNVPTEIDPSYSVYSSYDQKLPGTSAVYVDASEASDTVQVSGFSCSAHKYPVDAQSQVEAALKETLKNLLEGMRPVESRLTRADLRKKKIDTMIIVKMEDMDIDLRVIPGFFSAELESEAEVVFGITADTKYGRKLGTMVSGDGEGKAESGSACEGGADAIAFALEDALEDGFSKIGEAISNAPRLREAIAQKNQTTDRTATYPE